MARCVKLDFDSTVDFVCVVATHGFFSWWNAHLGLAFVMNLCVILSGFVFAWAIVSKHRNKKKLEGVVVEDQDWLSNP